MKNPTLLAVLLATLILGACSTREVTRETVIEQQPKTEVVPVPGPQGPPGPPGRSGDTTIIVPSGSSNTR